MFEKLKKIDSFSRNIFIVFSATSLVNFFNLLYQLLIAHRLSPSDFAAFNSLLSIFMIITGALSTIQLAVAKYTAAFNAQRQVYKIDFLLSDFFKKGSILAISTLLIFWFASIHLVNSLDIPSLSSGYILALLLALTWLTPILQGGVQGLELFGWLTSASIITGALRLFLGYVFILLGYNIAGALGAFLVANLVGIFIFYFPLRHFISFKSEKEDIDYKSILTYLFPVAISNFCFMALVTFDMVLVKYFFAASDSGIYSLAQMVGKIFLFLPGAISIVMFPRASALKAKDMDTISTLRRSFFYVLSLLILAVFFYNMFPAFTLKVLTGKVYLESIILGRLFSISMSFFALLFILISYFLSIRDLRFIKYLVLFTVLQFLGIILFHHSLSQIQLILCLNAILLFGIHLILVFRK